jgi:multiple sugar transport system permease protein
MFKRRRVSLFSLGPVGTIFAMIALIIWALVVIFPLYWIFITSFKLPIAVFSGPFYIPFVDFKPTLDAWQYILLGDLQRDTFRPYLSTIVVSTTSTVLALVFGSAAAYALTRFTYRPKLGAVGIFLGCLVLVIVAVSFGVPWLLAVAAGIALFFILLNTVARRFKRSLGNNDIAFWMITQRILPPVAVVIPIYILF